MDYFNLFNNLQNTNISLDTIAEHLPGVLHVNRTSDFKPIYLNPGAIDFLGVTSHHKVKKIQDALQLVHPDDQQAAIDAVLNYLENATEYKTVSFFQRFLNVRTNQYTAYFTTSMLIESRGGLVSFSIPMEDFSPDEKSINGLLAETVFIRKNTTKISKLTPNELSLLKVWAEHSSGKTISDIMKLSLSAVKSCKKRIYRKLEVKQYSQLAEYIRAFEITDNEKNGFDLYVNQYKYEKQFYKFIGKNRSFINPQYPCFYHSHNLDNFSVDFVDQEICLKLNMNLHDIRNMKFGFIRSVVHPEDISRLTSVLETFRNSASDDDIVSCIYRVRFSKDKSSTYTPIVTCFRADKKKNLFICISNTTLQQPVFTQKLIEALNKKHNTREKSDAFRTLSQREKEVIEKLKGGLNVNEIADQLSISPRTIEQHKKNLFKKIGVNSVADVINFFSFFF